MDEKTNLQINTNIIIKSIVNFIIPLVCLLLCIILGFFVVYPYYKNKKDVEAQIAKKLVLSQVLERKLVILTKLSDFKGVLIENSQLIDKVLVSESNVPQLLDEIFQIATNVGMKVTRLNYSFGGAKTTTEGGVPEVFEEVNVSLGVDGSYDQLAAFLKDTEVAARLLNVPSFRLVTDNEGKLSMNFNVTSPFLYVKSTAVTDEPVELDVTDPKFTEFVNTLKPLRFYEFLNKEIKVIETAEETQPTSSPTPTLTRTPTPTPTATPIHTP